MVRLHNKSKGFTIVELLIVIVVIGILATLVLVTFNGIQQKARDSKRKTDVNTTADALNLYYSNNNTYPTYAHLDDSTWVTANIKGYDVKGLQDPKGSDTTLVSGTTPTASKYAYSVTPAGCTDDVDSTTPCTNFTLNAKLEGDGSVFSKTSNN